MWKDERYKCGKHHSLVTPDESCKDFSTKEKFNISKVWELIKLQKKYIFEVVSLCLVAAMFFVLLGVTSSYKEKIRLLEEENQEIENYAISLQEQIEAQQDTVDLLGEELESLYALTVDLSTELSESILDRTDDSPSNVRQLIYASATHYGLDPFLCIAIARHETGNFTSNLFKNNYNLGGIRSGKGWAKYKTLIDGVNSFVLLVKTYCDKGMDTPEKMESVYCPDGSDWAGAVKKLMDEEQARGYIYYGVK